MKRAVLLVILLLLLALAHPLENILRSSAPPRPASSRIGVGRLMGSVLTGSFRPLLLTYLWIRSDTLYGQGRHDELYQHIMTMLALYPNNEQAREYLGWHLAFNLKNEAPNETLQWQWGQAGLDALAEVKDGPNWIAYWTLTQCGRNARLGLRYAGPEWELDKRWRQRLRAWSGLGRFETGLKVLEGRDDYFARAWRTQLLERLAYEDFLKTGESKHAQAAIDAMTDMARRFSDHPILPRIYLYKVKLLEMLVAVRADGVEIDEDHRHDVAMALWGIGAHRRQQNLLRAAEQLLVADDPRGQRNGPELAAVRTWIRYLETPEEKRGKRPPLPFDGMP